MPVRSLPSNCSGGGIWMNRSEHGSPSQGFLVHEKCPTLSSLHTSNNNISNSKQSSSRNKHGEGEEEKYTPTLKNLHTFLL